MIWFLLIITAICAAVFLFTPLLAQNTDKDVISHKPAMIGLAGITVAAIIGLYAFIGRPELTGDAQPPMSNMDIGAADGAALVAQLKSKLLATGSRDPNGWALLARSQMQIGQYEDAFKSYEMLIDISPGEKAYQTEYDQAAAYARRQAMAGSVLSQSPEDQEEMIKGMVTGLADRVYENGGTEQEWIRLLKARTVLGQSDLRAKDIKKMKQQFTGQPEMIERILSADTAK